VDQEAPSSPGPIFLFWRSAGCPNDFTDENWFQAEAELRNASLAPHRIMIVYMSAAQWVNKS